MRLVLMVALGVVVGVAGWAAGAEQTEVAPQARPVYNWFKAVKDGDVELLKSVFSKRMREKFEQEGWEKVLKTYQTVIEKEIGKYEMGDLAFKYAGTETEGKVHVTHKGKDLGALRVIQEDGGWKANER